MAAPEGAAVRRRILPSRAAAPILRAVGGEGCGTVGGGAVDAAGLSVPQSARRRALPDQGVGGSRRVGMDRRAQARCTPPAGIEIQSSIVRRAFGLAYSRIFFKNNLMS